eukprot:GHVU01225396.1.p1 GENE.GHVU01225396.1~~GHVU01225396.1.p1  ORF type:complete len:145 (+),score=4.72 GHVU01225396.1:101-535(+)
MIFIKRHDVTVTSPPINKSQSINQSIVITHITAHRRSVIRRSPMSEHNTNDSPNSYFLILLLFLHFLLLLYLHAGSSAIGTYMHTYAMYIYNEGYVGWARKGLESPPTRVQGGPLGTLLLLVRLSACLWALLRRPPRGRCFIAG